MPWGRGVRWLLLGTALTAPAWLLATESGLRFGLSCVERITHGAVRVEEASGRLIGDVELRGIAVETRAVSVRIAQADLNLRLTHLLVARVQAEWLTVQGLAVTVHGPSLPAPPHTPLTLKAPVYLAVEDGRLRDFHLRLADARQDWVVSEAQFAARWRGRWIRIGELKAVTEQTGPVQLHGRISIMDDLLHIEDFAITSPSVVNIAGAVALTDATQNALQLTWEKLRWPRPETLPWLNSPRGALTLDGPWRHYNWRLEAQTLGLEVPGDLSARGYGDLRSLDLREFRVKTLDGAVFGKGGVKWSPAVRTDLDVRWQNLNPVSRFSQWPGHLNGGVKLQVRWEQHRPLIQFEGGFDDSQLRGYPFALQTRGRTQQEKIFLEQMAVQSGASYLNVAGQLWPQLGLKGELHSTDFGSLWAGISGRGAVQFSAQGEPTAPRITLKASAQALGYGKYRAEVVALDARLDPGGRSDLNLKLQDVDAGIRLGELTLTGGGTRAAHQLALAASGTEGSVTLALTGAERQGVWRGSLTQARLVHSAPESPAKGAAPEVPGETWTLEEPAALSYARGRFDSEPVCLGAQTSRICARLGLAAGVQQIAFRIRNFDLHHLRPWLPGEWNVTGTLTGSAALAVHDGELTELRSDLDASPGHIEGGGVHMDYGPGRLQVEPEGGRLHAQWQLRPAGGEISAEVWVTAGGALLDRPMLGDLKVHLPDLSWLPVLSPEIAAAQGALDAHLDISGTPRAPSLDGKLQLAGGRLQLTTPGIELTDITASFERGHNAPLLLHAQALSGGGRIEVEGNIKTVQPKLAGEITFRGADVLGVNRPDIRAWLSPDLKLTLDGRSAKLTGQLGVPHAEITPRAIGEGGIAPSNDQVLVEEEAAAAQAAGHGMLIETEVKIALGDNVRFDGLGLKARLTGAITALDEPGRSTRGLGELRTDGGRYKAYGQDLQIETGRLIFSGGPVTDPAIDLTAFRKPSEEIKVGLHARGTLAAPEFSLFSEPAMTQEEQLAWLVLGRPLSSSDAGQRTQMAGAAMSLGLTGGDYLASRLAPRLGLDEVSIASKPGETTDLARFTIGKYVSPKLFVSYGVGLFQPGHFFRMQYDLTKHFKLVGESGLQQGGDVLYTIER